MDVVELRPGLHRWELPHPEWTPRDAEGGGWEEVVASYALEAPDGLVLIDPLAPPEGSAEADAFWAWIDEQVERLGGRSSHQHFLARAQRAGRARPLRERIRVGLRGGWELVLERTNVTDGFRPGEKLRAAQSPTTRGGRSKSSSGSHRTVRSSPATSCSAVRTARVRGSAPPPGSAAAGRTTTCAKLLRPCATCLWSCFSSRTAGRSRPTRTARSSARSPQSELFDAGARGGRAAGRDRDGRAALAPARGAGHLGPGRRCRHRARPGGPERLESWVAEEEGSRVLFLRRPERREGPVAVFLARSEEDGGELRRLTLSTLQACQTPTWTPVSPSRGLSSSSAHTAGATLAAPATAFRCSMLFPRMSLPSFCGSRRTKEGIASLPMSSSCRRDSRSGASRPRRLRRLRPTLRPAGFRSSTSAAARSIRRTRRRPRRLCAHSSGLPSSTTSVC